jgi:hypothetical protein
VGKVAVLAQGRAGEQERPEAVIFLSTIVASVLNHLLLTCFPVVI